MNIKSTVYDSLTPRQRVIATLEAEARKDDSEVARLRDSCPYKSYKQRDAAWSDTMTLLMGLSVAYELDLCVAALQWERYQNPVFLELMATIEHEYRVALSDYGIELETMVKAGCPRSPDVASIMREAIAAFPYDGCNQDLKSDVVRELLKKAIGSL